MDALRGRTPVTSREIEKSYNDNIELYSTPEQVRASHILLKTDGKNDAEVKTKAEEVLKEAKAGKDFAELAKKYLAGRVVGEERRRPRLLLARQDGPGVRRSRLLAASPVRSATW